MRHLLIAFLAIGFATLEGCERSQSTTAQASTSAAQPGGLNATTAAAPVTEAATQAVPAPPAEVLAAGTPLHVRLDEGIDTRRNRSGDRFTATLDQPVVSGDRVIVPAGVIFSGRVTEAKSSGRLRGRAVLALRLDSFELNGRRYAISSSSRSAVSKAHKRRNFLWIGGSSAGGAAIGAAAGGPGALIGAGVGAAAGTVGAAVTGKRQVSLPVETRLTFRLRRAVDLGS